MQKSILTPTAGVTRTKAISNLKIPFNTHILVYHLVDGVKPIFWTQQGELSVGSKSLTEQKMADVNES